MCAEQTGESWSHGRGPLSSHQLHLGMWAEFFQVFVVFKEKRNFKKTGLFFSFNVGN